MFPLENVESSKPIIYGPYILKFLGKQFKYTS